MPETGSDDYKAARGEHQFQKYNVVSQHVKLFKNFTTEVQKSLTSGSELEPLEVPIFGCSHDHGNWLLVTSRKVVFVCSNEKSFLNYSDICGMGWSSGPSQVPRENAYGIDFTIHTMDGEKDTKHYSPWLFISDASGNRHEVLLEPGAPLIAVWNSIAFLKQLVLIHSQRQ